MAFQIGNTVITPYHLMAQYRVQLGNHKDTVQKFITFTGCIRFATVDAAKAALDAPDTAVAMVWDAANANPLQSTPTVQRTISQCLSDVDTHVAQQRERERAAAKQAREPDKVKYNALRDTAKALGGELMTAAADNDPVAFAGHYVTFYYQAAYMGGDQFAVGAALKSKPTSRLILFYSDNPQETGSAKSLISFYGVSCGLTRDRLLPVKVADSKAACKVASDVVDARLNKTANPAMAGLDFLGLIPRISGATLNPVGGATTHVAASVMAGDGKGNVSGWTDVDPASNSYWAYRVDKFLGRKGIVRSAKYVIVWTRFSGQDGGAHPELDDTWMGLAQVCRGLLKAGKNIIVVGKPKGHDSLPEKLNASMDQLDIAGPPAVSRNGMQIWGEYWKNENEETFNGKIIGPNRAAEYAIFLRMARGWGCKLVHLGMRSGAMDAAALLGMRVRFIENTGNEQIERTTKWTGGSNTNKLYQRIQVSQTTRMAAAGKPKAQHEAQGYEPADLKLILDSVTAALV
ncbi:hypothetical protein [Pseudomonas sp. NPDC087639]|uniref:hypothetical protein n=1 Tax=Pseudomonas sp. NPDC087639 TaxID=3364445 RepID=UPI0038125B81